MNLVLGEKNVCFWHGKCSSTCENFIGLKNKGQSVFSVEEFLERAHVIFWMDLFQLLGKKRISVIYLTCFIVLELCHRQTKIITF